MQRDEFYAAGKICNRIRDAIPKSALFDEFFFEAWPPRGLDHQRYAELVRDRIMDVVGACGDSAYDRGWILGGTV